MSFRRFAYASRLRIAVSNTGWQQTSTKLLIYDLFVGASKLSSSVCSRESRTENCCERIPYCEKSRGSEGNPRHNPAHRSVALGLRNGPSLFFSRRAVLGYVFRLVCFWCNVLRCARRNRDLCSVPDRSAQHRLSKLRIPIHNQVSESSRCCRRNDCAFICNWVDEAKLSL